MPLTHADEFLCLERNHCGLFIFTLPRLSFGSPLSLAANTAQHPTTLPIFRMQLHERCSQNSQYLTYVSDITRCHSAVTGLFC